MIRRRLRAACFIVLWLGVPLHAEQRATHPYLGVTLIERTESSPRPLHMHVVQIDLTAPGLRFKLSPYSAFESPEQSYALLADAPGLNIDRENHASVVHRRQGQGDDGTRVEEPMELWTTFAGSAQIVTRGAASIPDLEWYRAVQARTAAGLSRDGRTLTLFTVDKSGGSEGMRLDEVAAILRRDYGVWQALNLDGGGSTTMVMADPVTGAPALVNASSDANHASGRAVGSSLAVFARPIPNP